MTLRDERTWSLWYALPEGSTILIQYSAITRTLLANYQLGKLKYAISAGYDVRLKNKSLRKKKIEIVRQAYIGH